MMKMFCCLGKGLDFPDDFSEHGGYALPETEDASKVADMSPPPLVSAAKINQVSEVRRLISEGVDPTQIDNLGKTALIWASANGQMEVAKLLLDSSKAKKQLHWKDEGGRTCLMWAAQEEQVEMVKFLVERGGEELVSCVDAGGKRAVDLVASKNSEITTLLGQAKPAASPQGPNPVHL